MSKSRTPFVVAVHVLVQRNNSLLLLKRANTGYCDGMYSVPAGHVESQETIIGAAQRELQEETGLFVQPDACVLAHVMSRRKVDEAEDRIDFFFAVKDWQGDPINAEPEKCTELRWVAATEIASLDVIPYIQAGVREVLQSNPFSWFSEQADSSPLM